MFHYIKIFELSVDVLAKLGCSVGRVQLYDTGLELEGSIIELTT